MPMNDKGELTNPDDSHKERDEYVGYTVCFCKQGIKLHQAGFDCETHVCAMCKCEVADPDVFFKFQDGGVMEMSK